MYLALQRSRGAAALDSAPSKWSFALLNVGTIGMAGSLMLSGIPQAFYERAIGGSTFNAFVQAQSNSWFVEGMYTRLAFGLLSPWCTSRSFGSPSCKDNLKRPSGCSSDVVIIALGS